MQKYINIIFSVIIIALTMALLAKCDHDQSSTVVIRNDTAMIRKISGIVTAYNQATVLQTQGQLKLIIAGMSDSIKKIVADFKKVQNTIVVRQKTEIKDSLRFKDSIPCSFPPIAVEKKTPFYSLKTHITNQELFIDDLEIFNKQTIVLGDKKTSFWGHAERQVAIVNSSPLVTTETIQNITIKEKRKWYEQPLITIPGGFLVGTTIVKSVQLFLQAKK